MTFEPVREDCLNVNPDSENPVLLIEDQRIAGCLVFDNRGFIIRLGPTWGATGYWKTAKEAIQTTIASKAGRSFVIVKP